MGQDKKPALVVLAAGMGSRYGGLKQLDAFGPNGENIIDYSIYDAIQAGFGSVVFIIRESFRKDFEDQFGNKFEDKLTVHFVTQELEDLPEGYTLPENRTKPWGTAHAVLMARDVVDVPFAVINADDFYGRGSFVILANYLREMEKNKDYAVVGYRLKNTLSEHGTVNRGICIEGEEGYLAEVKEIKKIRTEEDGKISYPQQEENVGELKQETLVSMNMWGFLPDYFPLTEEGFKEFLDQHGTEPAAEYYIPTIVDQLIKSGRKKVRLLTSPEHWFGVTYQEDKPAVIESLNTLIAKGVYPENLWG